MQINNLTVTHTYTYALHGLLFIQIINKLGQKYILYKKLVISQM